MRLFLDAHVSGRRIATALRERGHDIRAADEERALDGSEDEAVLELATLEDRIMVSFNVRDFPRILREWAEGGRDHAGCVILVGIDHSEFGAILRVLDLVLAARPEQERWHNFPCFASKRQPR